MAQKSLKKNGSLIQWITYKDIKKREWDLYVTDMYISPQDSSLIKANYKRIIDGTIL